MTTLPFRLHDACPGFRALPASLATAFVLTFSLAVTAAAQDTKAFSPSVWDGVFTAQQAMRGQTQYLQHCAACHGGDLEGTADAKALTGQRFWSDWKETTLDYLMERISTSMPFSEDGSLAGSLSAGTYADIVAHILNGNGFPAGPREMTKESAPGVKIVRMEGPGELPASTLVRFEGCLTKATDGWRVVKATVPVRTKGGIPAGTAASHTREFALKFVLTPLDKLAGNRVAVTGLLMGEGGKDGVNLSSASSIAPSCD